MNRVMIVAFALVCGVTGCERNDPDPPPQAPPPELTAEIARAALIDLIRSPESGPLSDFPLNDYIGRGVDGSGDSLSWGPFALDIKEREYKYTVAFGEPPRVCTWHYSGKFELQEGRWVALPPKVG